MKKALGGIFVIAVTLCVAWTAWYIYTFIFDRAPPHRFVVKSDENAESVELALGDSRGTKVTLMDGALRDFSTSRFIGDASGYIQINWPDGSNSKCMIGYITNGEREPHMVFVKNRRCPRVDVNL